MTRRTDYVEASVGGDVRFYTSRGLKPAARLETREYARARAAIPAWCLDGLPCGRLTDGTPAVALVVRAGDKPEDGPFRGEPWVVGGKWDMVTPWADFVHRKAVGELFGGREVDLRVDGPIGHQLFATGWGPDTDGPFGEQGLTLQYCYRVVVAPPLDTLPLQPDANHAQFLILRAGQPLPRLHPYIRDVIALSGWLAAATPHQSRGVGE